jgi:hypothetical protein
MHVFTFAALAAALFFRSAALQTNQIEGKNP